MLVTPSDAAHVARTLVALDAVRIAQGTPFFYTSGWASPVYVDARVLMSPVGPRTTVMDIAARALALRVAQSGINAVVGAESAGIAFAAWLAERLQLPLLYLRKRPVGWGLVAQLEGHLPPGARMLLVADVTTDGRSKSGAATALRQVGTVVDDALVLVDFAVYPTPPPRRLRTKRQHCACMRSPLGRICMRRCRRTAG